MTLPGAAVSTLKRPKAAVIRILLMTVIVAIVLLLIALSMMREESSRLEIVRSSDARARLSQLLDLAQAAENGGRAYLLTGEPTFLNPYNKAKADLPAQEQAIERVLGPSLGRGERLHRLNSLVASQLVQVAGDIEFRRKGAASGSDVLQRYAERYRSIDQVRALVHELIGVEAARLTVLRQKRSQARLIIDLIGGGALCGLLFVILITERADWRRQEERTSLIEEAKETAARLSAIFDSALDGIIILTPDGSIESVNPAAERMFGRSAASLINRDFSILTDMTSERFEAFNARMQRRDPDLEAGITRDLIAVRNDGSAFPVEVGLRGVAVSGRRRLVAVVRDVSERRRAERLKDEFVSTVSHELRTPLTSIAGALGLLKAGAGGVLPERAARLVQIADSNSTRLVRLINDILDMEKFEGGHAVLVQAPENLNEVAQRAAEMMAGLAEKRAVHLAISPAPVAPTVTGDADRMLQVLTNLLSNAIKFSEAGATVEVSVTAQEREAQVAVVDHGAGVPEHFRDRLFRKFAQADSSDARSHAGTGLGLAIAREISELHGGSLTFSPTVGGGASFFFRLPSIAVTEESVMPSPPRLLVCEDSALVVEMLRFELERWGYQVDTAGSAGEARLALHTAQYAALLLDLGLPDADGLTLVQALRAAPATRDVPVIVISGMGDDKGDAHRLNLVDWIRKPIDFGRLRTALKIALDRKARSLPLILHVDDDRDLLEVTRGVMGGAGEIVTAHNLASARAVLSDRRPDVVVLDLVLPDGSSLGLIAEIMNAEGGPIPTIVYTALDPEAQIDERVAAVFVKSLVGPQHLADAVRRITEDISTRVAAA